MLRILGILVRILIRGSVPLTHDIKYLHIIEYRTVSGVFQTIDPPPSPPSECVVEIKGFLALSACWWKDLGGPKTYGSYGCCRDSFHQA